MTELSQLYHKDYTAWARRNAELLRAGQFGDLDIENLLEELSDMSKSEQRELENRLTILLAHLLKWEYQFQYLSDKWIEFDGRSWRSTIIEQRDRIHQRLRKSPGLKSLLTATVIEAYVDAVELASDETGLSADRFPSQCPYDEAQLLDKQFYPEPRK
ncbi:DUF29 domain-containing protein [Allochromatium palmeri]|uniref:DUF29 family protein n=1 Tax=Allochromatium palmeri TaxID=231048 RepID=A0A6N8EIX3_9GAMM|nr:DUF29 domain-containing protein [Allochromatium palmeri]MTW22457.1 DUF29 family protein [Allochromatium palmeri]